MIDTVKSFFEIIINITRFYGFVNLQKFASLRNIVFLHFNCVPMLILITAPTCKSYAYNMGNHQMEADITENLLRILFPLTLL